MVSAAVGLLVATVGLDPNSAVPRFTFGQLRLFDGVDFVVVTLGLFAVSEILHLLAETEPGKEVRTSVGRVMISGKEFAASRWTMIRGTIVGFFTGVLPGAGGTIATFLAYSVEQRISDRDGTFGKGDLRGVAAPESANNAAATGALIPLLTLGIPGSGTTAVLLGALLGMNITPGPLLLERNPEIFWGLAASMFLGNVFLLVLNLPLVRFFVRILELPRWMLLPAVAALTFVAVYAVNASTLDLLLMTGFGVLGYGMRRAGFPLAPVILGVVLGPLMERSLRRSLALSGGDWGVLFSSPITLAFWGAAVLGVLGPVVLRRVRRAR
jgi:putative tricarboxylic transport membrane protein